MRTCRYLPPLLGLLALAFTPVAPSLAQVQFTEVSAAAGISGDTYTSGTVHSLGVNWIDYDNDGWPDLFAVAGDPPQTPHLFRNDGDGTFTRMDHLLPALPQVEMSGSVFADYDGDGDDDIYIYTDRTDYSLNGNNEPDGALNLLLKNLWVENGFTTLAGTPLFQEVAAAAGVEDAADPPFGDLPGYRAKTAGFVDYDRDGCIDLYVGHAVFNGSGTEPDKDRFYRNRCDGTFEDVTASSGVNPGTDPGTYRTALAFIGAHFDDDLWPDLYVVHRSNLLEEILGVDLFYRNEGDGTFTAVIAGEQTWLGDDCQAGMGIDLADIDHDGDWDIYISDFYFTTLDQPPLGNVLYLGNGDGTFADNSAVGAGVDGSSSWGVNFLDIDHDTWEDLYITTMPSAMTEFLFMNNGDGTFTDLGPGAGFATGNSRGSATADYDHDGDLDIAMVDESGPLRLFRNDTANTGNWLQLKLVGTESNRDAIGAVVEVTLDTLTLMRQVTGGSSAHSQNSLLVQTGLGDATSVDELRIRWPSGIETVRTDVPVNRFLRFVETDLFADGFESGDTSAWSAP